MSHDPEFSESFYRRHAQRYAEVSHNFIQSVYSDVSHPGLQGDTDLMDRLQELVPPGRRGLDAGCGAGARDVFFYWQRGYDIYGVDAVDENIVEARRLHSEIVSRVSVADLREPLSSVEAHPPCRPGLQQFKTGPDPPNWTKSRTFTLRFILDL